jgi:hypothetical protein
MSVFDVASFATLPFRLLNCNSIASKSAVLRTGRITMFGPF